MSSLYTLAYKWIQVKKNIMYKKRKPVLISSVKEPIILFSRYIPSKWKTFIYIIQLKNGRLHYNFSFFSSPHPIKNPYFTKNLYREFELTSMCCLVGWNSVWLSNTSLYVINFDFEYIHTLYTIYTNIFTGTLFFRKTRDAWLHK